MAPLRSLALAFIAYHCCEGARWSSGSPKNGAMLYTCTGGTATLSWNIDLTAGDVIQDIKWFLDDISMVRETIATSSRGSFFPVPGYDTRLKFLTNAGLQLDHVTTGDAGNYSVEIIGRDGFGAQFTMRRSVHVEVFNDLPTTDHMLHVIHRGVTAKENESNLALELRCGNFTYPGRPPFDVMWQLPSGTVFTHSTSYENGQFVLRLPAPVKGGNYTCLIPRESSLLACLAEESPKREATHYIDGVEVRLMFLEARQMALQKENDLLKKVNSDLKDSNSSLTHYVLELETDLQQSSSSLTDRVEALQVYNSSEPRVNFHAHYLNINKTTPPTGNSTLLVSDVMTNQGNAYNSSTGTFTAPYNGTYFFVGTTGSYVANVSAYFALVADDQIIAYSATRDPGNVSGQLATVHGVVHLNKMDKVCLLALSQNVTYFNLGTSFSGFLLYPDPTPNAVYPWPG